MANEPSSSSERMMTPELMITGEAVALEVAPASIGLRLISGAIDYAIYAGGFILSISVIITLFDMGLLPSAAVRSTVTSIVLALWVVVVPLTVEVVSRGRSAGRLVVGSRVVRDDGGALRLRHSLVRVLLATVEIWLSAGTLAAVACVATKRGKRLGDLLAGTYVVRDRPGVRDGAPLIMPPELAGWAGQADLRALPGDLALAARTFLQRASTMRPDARTRLARRLAARAEPYTSPPAPPGTNPERFLAAILVARRDREFFLELRDRRSDERALRALEELPHEITPPR
ncbi:MAG: RDD family protein [Actinomyces sp.]|uniref:RDD family protein n=1 Tax=Actinomyces sp. TaxID=29317 RepID=UPI0026DCECA4|nr:RDD family protein [Actinomyces sp.]MDO4242263.1 RDD family protein [Actinomyces sp.]